MLRSITTAIMLPLCLVIGSSSDNSAADVKRKIAELQVETVQKLIVANGSATIEVDLGRLNDPASATEQSKLETLQLTLSPDSFFTILVTNDALRASLPGSIGLIPQNIANLPALLSASLHQLVLEKMQSGEAYDLVVRDGKSGFVFFNVEGSSSDYDASAHLLSIREGRLLVSEEFAAALGYPSEAGSIAGKLSIAATMRTIEITRYVNGEAISDIMPSVGTVPGPDVIVGDLNGLSQPDTAAAGTQVGLSVGTDSCNAGTVDLDWFQDPNNDHPVIPQNIYRMSGGATNDQRFEQIGQSSVKHAFTALTQNICGYGCNGVGGTHLGSGCSDPYVVDLNSGGSGHTLGSRAWINPFTGNFPRGDSATPPNSHSGHTHNAVSHRMLVEINDLNTSLNPGATYYAEAMYVTPHEYVWCQSHPGQCNMYNNVSYRRYNVTGTTGPFTFQTGGFTTQRMLSAIRAWTGATINQIEPAPGIDGIGAVGYKVTNPSPGVWHYEYAVYNQNIDRAIQSFAVPLGAGVTISNIGFHAPPQHPGWAADGTVGNAGFSSTPWTPTQTSISLTWNSETFAQNQNANAIRWGTLYNFRFDANSPPQATNATVGFFKTGSPITVGIQGPSGLGTPSPTPTATATSTGTPSPTPTATATATATPTVPPTPTPTPTVTPCVNYGYTVGTGSIVPGTTDTGNHVDDNSTLIALPFSYRLYDQTFTTVSVGSNGHLTFGTVNNGFNASCIPQATTTYAIFPYRTDLCTGPCGNVTATDLGIFTSTSGVAPNRIFNIEYRTAYYNSGAAGVRMNFEVRLFEGLTDFDVIYGTVGTLGFANDGPLSVGVQRTDTTQSTLVGCDPSGGQAPPVNSGQLYHYSLGAGCSSPTPTPATTPTPTPTATATATATGTPSPSPTVTPCSGVAFSERFDSVAAPALPTGWVASNVGGTILWITSTTSPDTAPNDAFINDPNTITDKRLDTQSLTVSSALAQVTFRHSYNLEASGGQFYDGGVLEVSSPNINGGAFTDITAAAVGGSFASGPYNGTINGGFNSPIAGRMAWSGNSGGYITTVVNLGPNVNGQTIKLRFRMASDSSTAGTGWRVDTITSTGVCVVSTSTPTPTPTLTATPTPTPPPATPTPTPTPPPPTPTSTPTPTPTSTPGCGATVFLPAQKDNTLYEDANGQLSNGAGIYLFTGMTDGFGLRRGLIAFDLTSIPSNATITGATLSMFLTRSGPNSAGVNMSLSKVLNNWGEGASDAGEPGGSGIQSEAGDATWIHTFYNTSFWTTPGGDFSATVSATTPVGPENTTHTWSGSGVLADVQTWVSNPATNFGWIIRADEVTAASAQRLNTHENSNNPPQLMVTYQVPCATPTPTPNPTVSISGTVLYCSNPVPGPVPNVTLTLTGSGSGSTLSDASGNYQFSSLVSGGTYTVTPTKAARTPGSNNINTVDVIATQRHFLNIGTPLSGCRLAAADVNGSTVVDTIDVIAIQRFFLGLSTGIANTGKYQFTPSSRTYTGIVSNQTGQNYDTLVFGDVASSFVERPDGP